MNNNNNNNIPREFTGKRCLVGTTISSKPLQEFFLLSNYSDVYLR